jgi:hypothetical protein
MRRRSTMRSLAGILLPFRSVGSRRSREDSVRDLSPRLKAGTKRFDRERALPSVSAISFRSLGIVRVATIAIETLTTKTAACVRRDCESFIEYCGRDCSGFRIFVQNTPFQQSTVSPTQQNAARMKTYGRRCIQTAGVSRRSFAFGFGINQCGQAELGAAL